MSRIDERLEAMGIDASGMTDEQKFTAATGLTRYDAEMAANDWYVPGGAANVNSNVEETVEEQEPEIPTGDQGEDGKGDDTTTEPTEPTEPTGDGEGAGDDTTTEPAEPIETTEPTEGEGETGGDEDETKGSTAEIETE